MSDTFETPDEETTPDAEALAAELDLGIDLSPEEQAEAQQMVARLREQFGLDEEGAPQDEPEEVDEEAPGEVEEEPLPAQAASASSEPPSTRGVIVIDGVEVPVEEAVKVLIDRERTAPIEPPAAATVPPQPPQAPEWLDQDDPAQMAMWRELETLKANQAQVANNQAQIAQRQEIARATADAEAGIHTFRTMHPELSEEDLTKLRLHAVSLDIIDGLAKSRNGPDAIVKALDIAYWDHPEFRARATAVPTPTEAKKEKAAERKGKLNALGGSSGSAPRQEARPDLSTDAAAKAAATEWLKGQNIL